MIKIYLRGSEYGYGSRWTKIMYIHTTRNIKVIRIRKTIMTTKIIKRKGMQIDENWIEFILVFVVRGMGSKRKNVFLFCSLRGSLGNVKNTKCKLRQQERTILKEGKRELN